LVTVPTPNRRAVLQAGRATSSERMIVDSSTPISADAARVVLDLTDLCIYYRHAVNVTGIQRVIERLTASKCLQDDQNTVFVMRAPGTDVFAQVDKALFAGLAQPDKRLESISKLNSVATYLDDYRLHQRLKKYPWKRFRRKYQRIIRRAKGTLGSTYLSPFEFCDDDRVVLPGAYWIHSTARLYGELRRRHDLHLCVFVHDLIPLTDAWCIDQEAARSFRKEFDGIVPSCDRFVAVSKHVTDELSAYMKAISAEGKPILTLSYGWDFPKYSADREEEAKILARYRVQRRAFILVVSTLDLRKNHALIARAARNLYPRVKDRMPPILFVGKRGIGFNFLEQELVGMGYLGGRIQILPDVTDDELASLYAACRFTIYPSFVEGWGLPVQESLAFGRPCLASSATSIPEAGLDLAAYFDPCDSAEFESLLLRWIESEVELEVAEARIARYLSTHQLPTWNECASTIVDFARSDAVNPKRCSAASGNARPVTRVFPS
jgi:glycosyltransferase involved in cell wall biosynthesis